MEFSNHKRNLGGVSRHNKLRIWNWETSEPMQIEFTEQITVEKGATQTEESRNLKRILPWVFKWLWSVHVCEDEGLGKYPSKM